jgi:hypothetical protein
MAYATGTATGFQDLYDKLLAFLKTDETLVAAGQNWQVAWQNTTTGDVVLRGPGLSNQDQIYIGFSLFKDPPRDSYWIEIRGMTGVLPGATNYSAHINTSDCVRMFVDTQPMTYWFVASGRRFAVVVKISTVFQTLYGGLYLPYATPLSYNYPLFIGGSAGPLGYFEVRSWRDETDSHSLFPCSYRSTSITGTQASAYFLNPGGNWYNIAVRGNLTEHSLAPEQAFDTWGTSESATSHYGMNFVRFRSRECFGGQFALHPCTIVRGGENSQTYGVLDGVFRVQGFGNSSENLVTIGGVDHLVVQNVFRTSIDDYWALALE